MQHEETQQHYLLDPLEAELLACFRTLSDESKAAIANLIASQVGFADRQLLVSCVKMRLVKG